MLNGLQRRIFINVYSIIKLAVRQNVFFFFFFFFKTRHLILIGFPSPRTYQTANVLVSHFPKQTDKMQHAYLSLGTGEAGGGDQLMPLANSLVRAVATARAAGVGAEGAGGTC